MIRIISTDAMQSSAGTVHPDGGWDECVFFVLRMEVNGNLRNKTITFRSCQALFLRIGVLAIRETTTRGGRRHQHHQSFFRWTFGSSRFIVIEYILYQVVWMMSIVGAVIRESSTGSPTVDLCVG
jgi:hypothetical protein